MTVYLSSHPFTVNYILLIPLFSLLYTEKTVGSYETYMNVHKIALVCYRNRVNWSKGIFLSYKVKYTRTVALSISIFVRIMLLNLISSVSPGSGLVFKYLVIIVLIKILARHILIKSYLYLGFYWPNPSISIIILIIVISFSSERVPQKNSTAKTPLFVQYLRNL